MSSKGGLEVEVTTQEVRSFDTFYVFISHNSVTIQ